MEKITSDEFYSLPSAYRGSDRGPLRRAIEAMEIDTGIKMTCIYNHTGTSQVRCNGKAAAYVCATKAGVKISTRCIEGMLYVLRTK